MLRLFLIAVTAFGYIIQWIGISLLVYFTIVTWWSRRRYLKLKNGPRITPNGDLGILITGATSGFGLALAKLFYKLGFTIFATYFNDKEPGYLELKDLGSRPYESNNKSGSKKPKIFLIHMDVRSKESIEASGKEVDLLLEEHNIKLYSLINNAGVSHVSPFEWCLRDSILNIVNTNLTGTMLVTRQFLLRIVQNKGRIINVSSGTFVFPGNTNSTYGSTKAAIVHFSLALHDGIKKYGSSCHCIIPGNFLTVSNIIYPTIQAMLKNCNSLTPEEQNVYDRSLSKFKHSMFGLLRAKLKNSGDDLQKMAAVYNFDPAEIEPRNHKRTTSRKRGFFSLPIVKNFFGALSGSGSSLEDSNALEAYEQAVCLKRPYLRLYAGNSFYAYVIGPLLEFLPSIFCEKIGGIVIAQVSST